MRNSEIAREGDEVALRKQHVEGHLRAGEGNQHVGAVGEHVGEFVGGVAAAAVEAADVLQRFPRHAGESIGGSDAQRAFARSGGMGGCGLSGHVGQFVRIAAEVAGNGIVLKKNNMHGEPRWPLGRMYLEAFLQNGTRCGKKGKKSGGESRHAGERRLCRA